jgi:hypothetical protein
MLKGPAGPFLLDNDVPKPMVNSSGGLQQNTSQPIGSLTARCAFSGKDPQPYLHLFANLV